MPRAVALLMFSWWVAASPAMAETLSTRELLSLDKFGKDISSISWCSDESLTFVDTFSPPAPGQDAWRQPGRNVKMLSLVNGDLRSLLAYPTAFIRADCVRGGEFLYISGSADLGFRIGASREAEPIFRGSFNHLVEIHRGESTTNRPTTINLLWDVDAFREPVSTDAAGNVFGRRSPTYSATEQLLPKSFDLKDMPPRQREAPSYTVKKDDFTFIVFASDQDRLGTGNAKIGIYGVATPQLGSQSLGSYQCPAPAPRPGCADRGATKNVVYYTLSFFATSPAPGPDGRLVGHQALYTVVPGKRPLIQRWPIVNASASGLPYELAILDVALDAQRCLVLLEPDRRHASSRLEGRLRQDVLIADCAIKDGQLAFYEPRLIGHKQGSFIFPRLALRGDTVVVSDFYDQSSQEDDQIELERAENEKAKLCVQLFRGARAAYLQRTNALCAPVSRLGGGWDVQHVIVSPTAKFVALSGRDGALVVGRDYRSDGREPGWLTNGD